MKFGNVSIFQNSTDKMSLKSENNNMCFMRNVSDKTCTENQNTHFMFSNSFSKNHAIYEKMWKNMVQLNRLKMKINTVHACMLDN